MGSEIDALNVVDARKILSVHPHVSCAPRRSLCMGRHLDAEMLGDPEENHSLLTLVLLDPHKATAEVEG